MDLIGDGAPEVVVGMSLKIEQQGTGPSPICVP